SRSTLQPDGRTSIEGDRARLLVDGDSDLVAEPPQRRRQAEDQGDGRALRVHRVVRLAREVLLAWRLPQTAGGRLTTSRAGLFLVHPAQPRKCETGLPQ